MPSLREIPHHYCDQPPRSLTPRAFPAGVIPPVVNDEMHGKSLPGRDDQIPSLA
jgi:hypothetical protein